MFLDQDTNAILKKESLIMGHLLRVNFDARQKLNL